MKTVIITLIVLATCALICFVRGGLSFPIARVLPFASGGGHALIYDVGAIIMILLAIRGIRRIGKPADDDTSDEPEPPGSDAGGEVEYQGGPEGGDAAEGASNDQVEEESEPEDQSV